MDAPLSERTYDLPLIQLISDPEVAAIALKTPRPAILAALRAPDSASGLARRLAYRGAKTLTPGSGVPEKPLRHGRPFG